MKGRIFRERSGGLWFHISTEEVHLDDDLHFPQSQKIAAVTRAEAAASRKEKGLLKREIVQKAILLIQIRFLPNVQCERDQFLTKAQYTKFV